MRLKRPRNGDIRWKSKFFWIPTRFDDRKIWLESALVKQEYLGSPYWGWRDICLYDSRIHEIEKNWHNQAQKTIQAFPIIEKVKE